MTQRSYQPDESFARALDEADPLRSQRDRFHLPTTPDGRPTIYFCTHSLGLQPRTTRELMLEELDRWAVLGVQGHFHPARPWYTYQEELRPLLARLVGARPEDVILMNGLTVNLHLLMTSFYRPTADRRKILLEEPTFPSDRYAVLSQLRLHGHDAAEALLTLPPRPGEHLVREEDYLELLERRGREIALVLINPVNFFTGQWLDVPRLAAAARRQGATIGLDLAHAIGNVPVRLNEWDVDFAVWCTYKYLCGGPGAVGGAFVHERHGRAVSLPRLAGWWGNDPATRFRMQLQPEFVPHVGAAGWQVSNPPVLALAPLRASLPIYDDAGMPALRAKAESLTGYLEYLLQRLPPGRFEQVTPREPGRRGCQLSLLVHERPQELFRSLEQEGVIGDFRAPNVIRVAPVPLYNTFHEIWRFVEILRNTL